MWIVHIQQEQRRPQNASLWDASVNVPGGGSVTPDDSGNATVEEIVTKPVKQGPNDKIYLR